MNRKKLPRAVTQTADEMRRVNSLVSMPLDVSGPNVAGSGNRPGNGSAAADQATASQVPIQSTVTLIVPTHASKTPRQSQANAIVERYANFAALGGVIPLPLVNVASVTVIILRMVKLLCALYAIPYERGRARALVVGLAAGAVPTTASAVTSSTLVYFVPGANLVGLAVSSVTASACARAVGQRFVEHFEKGADLADFAVIDRR